MKTPLGLLEEIKSLVLRNGIRLSDQEVQGEVSAQNGSHFISLRVITGDDKKEIIFKLTPIVTERNGDKWQIVAKTSTVGKTWQLVRSGKLPKYVIRPLRETSFSDNESYGDAIAVIDRLLRIYKVMRH